MTSAAAQAAERDRDLHEDRADGEAEVHQGLEDREEAGDGIGRRGTLEEGPAGDIENGTGEAGCGQEHQREGDVLLDADERERGHGREEGEHEGPLQAAPSDQEGGDEAGQERAGAERRVEIPGAARTHVEIRGGEDDAEQVHRADEHVVEAVQRQQDAQRGVLAQRGKVGAQPRMQVGQRAAD